ncbi:MAG: hypothetical protein WCO51_07520 [bacterium]
MAIKARLVPKVGVGALSSPLEVGAGRAPAAAAALEELLQKLGCDVIQCGSIDTPEKATAAGLKMAEGHVDAIALAPACWFEDYLVLDLLEECDRPILFWPQPGMETGALCGTQQFTAFMKQLEKPYTAVFGTISEEKCANSAMSYLRAAALKSRMRRARIGAAGQRIPGMTHTSANEFMLKKIIGPRVVPLDLPLLLKRANEMLEDEAKNLWQEMVSKAGSCKVKEAEGIDSMRVYAAIRELFEEHKLDAASIGCYPHLMGRVCLAASLLADEGFPLACEGDINGAVAQYMLTLLSSQPTHNTDWLDPMEDGTVIFTHCGSGSFSLAHKQSEIALNSVRLMGQGVCALFPAKPGHVTLIGFVPSLAGYQCALLEGEALPSELVFPGNPLRVRFNKPTPDIINWIHEEGIGHHWMIAYGSYGEEIRNWSKMVGPGFRLLEI